MRRFKNILLVAEDGTVPPDVSDRALSLAKQNGARVTLVDVIALESNQLPRFFGTRIGGNDGTTVERQMFDLREAQLNEIAAPFREAEIPIDTKVLAGVPFIEIIRQVLRDGHDLLMKAAGTEERRWRIFTSTELHLLRKCPCPVFLVRPRRSTHFDNILAAVDPFQDDQEGDPLAQLIMDLATSLAEAEKGTLSIIHTWHLVGEEAMRKSAMTKIPKADIDRLVAEERQRNEERLVRLVQLYPGLHPAQVHLVKGPPQDAIVEYVQQVGADLIVMGTIGHTGVQGLLIGNTAESVITRVECSVMAVKPANFTSPVTLD